LSVLLSTLCYLLLGAAGDRQGAGTGDGARLPCASELSFAQFAFLLLAPVVPARISQRPVLPSPAQRFSLDEQQRVRSSVSASAPAGDGGAGAPSKGSVEKHAAAAASRASPPSSPLLSELCSAALVAAFVRLCGGPLAIVLRRMGGCDNRAHHGGGRYCPGAFAAQGMLQMCAAPPPPPRSAVVRGDGVREAAEVKEPGAFTRPFIFFAARRSFCLLFPPQTYLSLT
jgi:hypothetical protein